MTESIAINRRTVEEAARYVLDAWQSRPELIATQVALTIAVEDLITEVQRLRTERDAARADAEPRAEHEFDEDSVLDSVAGKPYGPGPLWAGTEPMDYPDPLCTCGAPWFPEGGCSSQVARLIAENGRLMQERDAASMLADSYMRTQKALGEVLGEDWGGGSGGGLADEVQLVVERLREAEAEVKRLRTRAGTQEAWIFWHNLWPSPPIDASEERAD